VAADVPVFDGVVLCLYLSGSSDPQHSDVEWHVWNIDGDATALDDRGERGEVSVRFHARAWVEDHCPLGRCAGRCEHVATVGLPDADVLVCPNVFDAVGCPVKALAEIEGTADTSDDDDSDSDQNWPFPVLSDCLRQCPN